jgi:hypothetical protein
VSESNPEGRDPNRLIQRVDALMKRQQEDSRRASEEVPLLTEIVAPDAAQTPEAANAEKALASDIERVLLVRLIPELNKQVNDLRAGLEKEMRRSVRKAIEHALAERKAKPGRK